MKVLNVVVSCIAWVLTMVGVVLLIPSLVLLGVAGAMRGRNIFKEVNRDDK